jgi:hypothetical protein
LNGRNETGGVPELRRPSDFGELSRVATAEAAGLVPAAAGGEKTSLQDWPDEHDGVRCGSRFMPAGYDGRMDLIEFVATIVAFLRVIGGWLGLIEKQVEPSPPDPTAEHRPDGRAVPMLIVDDDKPPLPPPAPFPGID